MQDHKGRAAPISLGSRTQASWNEITDWISKDEGRRVQRQSIQRAFEGTLSRLKELLLEDPYIREWLLENNIDISDQ